MKTLFQNTDIASLPLLEYISLFLEETNPDHDLIQIPPIQRNAVWKLSQIERLWDTLLRGFPIGSFLLSERRQGQKARTLTNKTQTISQEDGFFLLDGQQRTRSILLGFQDTDTARLWIDLAPQLTFGNADQNDRRFLFRLTTSHQPWGMKKNDPNEKLSEKQKADAREYIDNATKRYDYETSIQESFPIEANLPIPFAKLVELCGGLTGIFHQPDWSEITPLIPEYFREDKIGNVQQTVPEPAHFSQILKALQRILDKSENNEMLRSVALLKHHGELDATQEDDEIQDENNRQQEEIEVLFRRVNSGGTVLAGEEMQYSILKAVWDDAYQLVSEIINDTSIGYLYSSTNLVMAATRLARFNQKETDVPAPNVNAFRKWIGKTEFLSEMKNLLDKKESQKALFHTVLEKFCNIVLYRENDSTDAGFPKKFLLSIDKKYYQPVITWIYLNIHDNEKIEANRLPILRYLMFTFIGFTDANKTSKKALEVVKENQTQNFPDLQIYQTCLPKENTNETVLAYQIPDVQNFSLTLNTPITGLLRYWHEIVGDESDKYRNFRSEFWRKRELLLWFQREYHAKWFKGYNPMSDDAFDTPYDYDHILPASHISGQGSANNMHDSRLSDESKNRFRACRNHYINSIGNLRTWAYWANRSDQDKCHTIKLKLNNNNNPIIDKTAQELGLNTNIDFLKASMIDTNDFNLWLEAEGTPKQWSAKRRKSWQEAVEKRVIYLYTTLFNAFEFDAWLIQETEK